jgi:uncharacterized protein
MRREMRRKDREVTDRAWMESVIGRSQVCRLAMCDGDQPYVIPMCVAYHDNVLYFHCAGEGMKTGLLRANPKVCVEFDIDTELIESGHASGFGMKYRSVIAFGTASFVDELDAKRAALDVLMAQYSEKAWTYPDAMVEGVCIFKVDIDHMTGKRSHYDD